MEKDIAKNLIEKVSNGDEEAYLCLSHGINDNIVNYVSMFLNNKMDSIKLTNELLIDLPQLCKTYLEQNNDDFNLWIKKIAKDKAIETIIKNNKLITNDDELYKQYGIKFMNDVLLNNEFKNIFNDEEYSVLILYLVFKVDFDEISKTINKSKKEIKEIYNTSINKALNYLKK